MDQHGTDSPPLFFQPPPTALLRRHRRPSSPILTPVTLIIPTAILVVVLMIFLPPFFLSRASQILGPNSVRNGWDIFNVVVVLFAVFCGVLGRNNGDDSPTGGEFRNRRINVSDTDNKVMNDDVLVLRQWFDDNFEPEEYRNKPAAMEYVHRRERRSGVEIDGSGVKVIPVDTYVVRLPPSSAPTTTKPPVAPPFPPKKSPVPETPKPVRSPSKSKRRRSPKTEHEASDQNPRSKGEFEGFATSRAPIPPSHVPKPPSPPTPPPTPMHMPLHRNQKVEQKKSTVATKETETAAIAKLSNHTKTKANIKKIYQNGTDPSLISKPANLIPPSPPPPPLPRPNSVFHNIFKKGSKNTRIYSASPSPPPAPPPLSSSILNNIFKHKSKRFGSSSTPPALPPPPPSPPSSIFNHLFKSVNKSKRFNTPSTSKSPSSPPPPPPPPSQSESHRRRSVNKEKPPVPTKANDYNYHQNRKENVNSSSESLTITMPPLPSLRRSPPIKMQEAKRALMSPELENVGVSSTASPCAMIARHPGGPIIGASPDVNVKAEKFIARLRHKWTMEKMDFISQNQ